MTDLPLLEAKRVLKPGGRILIGLYVDGDKCGFVSFERRIQDSIKAVLGFVGIESWKDHYIWLSTYQNLLKLVTDNSCAIDDSYWQPQWKNMPCYVCARKSN